MTKVILVCCVLSFSLFLSSCSSDPKQVTVEVSCDEFYDSQHIRQEVDVPVGASFKVVLCSNPSTGFQWEEAEISDVTVLAQVDRQFVSPDSEPPPPPGTPGQDVWTFKSLKAGASTIAVDYSRPWEGGEKGEWTFVLSVVVK